MLASVCSNKMLNKKCLQLKFEIIKYCCRDMMSRGLGACSDE